MEQTTKNIREFAVTAKVESYKISAVDRRAVVWTKLEGPFNGYPKTAVIGFDLDSGERKIIPDREENIQSFLYRTPEAVDGN